ncbi:MAG: hypothetical protein IPK83_12775 [Planctomycetes bacterium]|nr:hypothetical protein [Planctomycetota bacterium]
MDIFVGIILVVGFITIIGHGIWMAAAWVLRGGRPRQDRAGHEPTLNDDRAAVARYLQHLESYELIDATTRAHWMRLVAKESRESLTSREPAPLTPISSPVETPLSDAGDVPEKEEVIAELWPSEPTPPSPIIAKPTAAGTTPEKKDAFDRLIAAKSTTAPARFASPVAPATPAPPPEPRRPLSEVLAGFMAEKNIRWGELIGGLLIICCSTALVISLWSRIESIPILKFIIFTVVTSALAGAGLFIHHRWKLPTTGHAILVISTMLVPLNLLAFAAFSSAGELGGGVVIGLEAVALRLLAG